MVKWIYLSLYNRYVYNFYISFSVIIFYIFGNLKRRFIRQKNKNPKKTFESILKEGMKDKKFMLKKVKNRKKKVKNYL